MCSLMIPLAWVKMATHQPVEQLAHLRATPQFTVIRPADANETKAAWAFALKHKNGPVALILTRQNLPVLSTAKYPHGGQVEKGAYVISEAKGGAPEMILIATGSEVSLALSAQERLEKEGIRIRVVSMPSWELFEKQEAAYKNEVLPKNVRKRISIEALSKFGWERYTGSEGEIIGLTTFGASAPGEVALKNFGFTVDNVVKTALKLLEK